MIDPDHPRLSIVRQCELASVSRASFYREPAGEREENLVLMRLIDEAFLDCPFYGARQMMRHLRRLGWKAGHKRVRRLMRKIGLAPIYQAPKTSVPHPRHKVYPYLLRHRPSGGPTRSGAPMSPTSRCGGASFTLSPSWIGRRERFWRGVCRTRWKPTSASRRLRKPSRDTQRRKSSTRIVRG